MRRSPSKHDALDRGAAAPARLARAAVDAEFVLIPAHQSGAADIVPNRGAAPLDGAAQHRRNGAAQLVCLSLVEPATERPGMQACFKTGLVRIDIAYSGDDALIQQDRFQVSFGPRQRSDPVGGRNFKRLRPKLLTLEKGMHVRAARK